VSELSSGAQDESSAQMAKRALGQPETSDSFHPGPLVSICVPAYNAERWIAEAIESALAQTWQSFELVIADNASTDSTLEIARSYSDPRIQVVSSPENTGLVRNHNHVIRLSTGTYIKFLHADDRLAPDCVEEMVGLAREDERIGLVFAPREVLTEGAEGLEWARHYSRLHECFSSLLRINEGRVLFMQLVDAGIQENWVGEPSAVLLTRHALERSGLFNAHLHQIPDLELWMRIMLTHRVGFVDRPLSVYRHHRESETFANARVSRDWLDGLWLLEGLLGDEAIGAAEKTVERLRRKALRRALRSQLGRLARRQLHGGLSAYFKYRALAVAGLEARNERLEDQAPGAEGAIPEGLPSVYRAPS